MRNISGRHHNGPTSFSPRRTALVVGPPYGKIPPRKKINDYSDSAVCKAKVYTSSTDGSVAVFLQASYHFFIWNYYMEFEEDRNINKAKNFPNRLVILRSGLTVLMLSVTLVGQNNKTPNDCEKKRVNKMQNFGSFALHITVLNRRKWMVQL